MKAWKVTPYRNISVILNKTGNNISTFNSGWKQEAWYANNVASLESSLEMSLKSYFHCPPHSLLFITQKTKKKKKKKAKKENQVESNKKLSGHFEECCMICECVYDRVGKCGWFQLESIFYISAISTPAWNQIIFNHFHKKCQNKKNMHEKGRIKKKACYICYSWPQRSFTKQASGLTRNFPNAFFGLS